MALVTVITIICGIGSLACSVVTTTIQILTYREAHKKEKSRIPDETKL